MYTGHQVVKVFGHEKKAVAEFDEVNEKLYQAGRKAQFISGMIMPLMSFIGNLSYVIISVVGGILVTQRAISIGDIQAFITYTDSLPSLLHKQRTLQTLSNQQLQQRNVFLNY